MKKYLMLLILAFTPLILGAQNQFIIKDVNGRIVRSNGLMLDYLSYNPIAISIFNRWSPEPNANEKFAINRLIDTIEYYGVWDKADIYRIYAANSETSANINIKSTSFTAAPQNSYTFFDNEGYGGDGATAYIMENYNPYVDADSFQLSNATVHMYNNSNNLATNDMLFSMYDGTNWIELFNLATSSFRIRLNNLTAETFVYAHKNNILGGLTLTRDNSNDLRFMRDNGIYVSENEPESALPNQANGLFVLAWNNQGNPATENNNTASFFYIGAALTQLQSQKQYEAEKLFLDYFGKSPSIVINEITIDPLGGGNYTSIGDALDGITDNNYWNQYNLNISDTLYEFGLDFADKDYIHLIGNDTSTAKIIGYLPADTTEAAIQATSTIDCHYTNFTVRNVHISIQNGRYAVHSDAGVADEIESSLGVTQNFIGCKFTHEGNAEANVFYGHTVWNTPDAFGAGFSYNMTVNIDSCEAISKGDVVTTSRGISMHSATSSVYKSTMNISNTICRTNTTYALRIGMLFNNQDEYYFDNVQLFGGGFLINGSGTYDNNTTEIGTDPIILNGNLIAD